MNNETNNHCFSQSINSFIPSYVVFFLLGVLLLVYGCSKNYSQSVLTMHVTKSDIRFIIPAKGELISARETPINAPMGNFGNLTLAWLKEENSVVKKGDVVARFDGSSHEIQLEKSMIELQKNNLTKSNTERQLEQNQYTIQQQSSVVDEEMAVAERFTVDDLMVYSKNEIIDQMLNKEYLESKRSYLYWRKDFQVDQSTAELELLNLRGQAHEESVSLNNLALDNLEVNAPENGIFIYAKNWRGEKIRPGEAMWPGSKIASIPSLAEMNGKIYVLESEAAGLQSGQSVEMVLDAFPDRPFSGVVESVASIAASRSVNSPIKYFEVQVKISKTDPDFMKPGQKLTAEILVADEKETISVPNQAIFKSGENRWVYQKNGNKFIQKSIEVGIRSLTSTQVLSGLAEGDEIALMKPSSQE